MKPKFIIRAISSGILASIAGICYQFAYESALSCKFSKIINPVSISMASIIGTILMTLGYWMLSKLRFEKYRLWYFMLINILSIASIIGPMSSTLPLDIENPELFPGLIAPLHLFPALSFITLSTNDKNE